MNLLVDFEDDALSGQYPRTNYRHAWRQEGISQSLPLDGIYPGGDSIKSLHSFIHSLNVVFARARIANDVLLIIFSYFQFHAAFVLLLVCLLFCDGKLIISLLHDEGGK